MGLRSAVNAMCKACIYDPHAGGNWKQQVSLCTSFNCPLYSVRPMSTKPIPKAILREHGLKMADFPANCGFSFAPARPARKDSDFGSKNGRIATPEDSE